MLPLGASGHLALLPQLAGTADERVAVAAAAHAGIIVALMLYFWRDMAAMAVGLWKLVKGRLDPGARLFLQLLIGSVPALLLGWGFTRMGGGFGGVGTAAAAMAVFGLFLLVADRLGMTVRRMEHMSYFGAFAIGVLQAASLIPGVSRTGITITAVRLMGYERVAAVRFSLLLAIPAFAGHALFSVWKLSRESELLFSSDLAVAAAAAGLMALIGVAAMMAWVRRADFAPFAVWRLLLGGGMLAWLAWGG